MIRAGQILQKERLRKGFTLKDVSNATKIQETFLAAIESGEYEKLPASSYAQGFVRNYAAFLGIAERNLLPIFRREFNEKEYFRVLPEGMAGTERGVLTRVRVGLPVLTGLLLALFVSGFILFQYRFALLSPPLEVSVPQEGEVVSQKLTVFGKTDPNAAVFVNGEPVSVARDGIFRKTLSLFEGRAILRIVAKNRIGSQTIIERHAEVR